MKEWLKYGIFLPAIGRIWCASAVAIAVGFIPLYIWRGSFFGDPGVGKMVEDIIMTFFGLVAGFAALVLIQSRREGVLDYTREQIKLDAAYGVGTYMVLWILWGFISLNNYPIALCGFHLSNLLIQHLHFKPERLAFVLSALVYSPVFYYAQLVGVKLAERRGRRTCRGLKRNGGIE